MRRPRGNEPARRDVIAAVGWGCGIWLLATAALLFAGDAVLPQAGPGSSVDSGSGAAGVLLVSAFGVGAGCVAVLAYALYRRGRSDTVTLRLLFGSTIAVTGLLLDAVVYAVALGRYPTLAESRQGPVAFFLLLAYGTLLVAPHLLPTRPSKEIPA